MRELSGILVALAALGGCAVLSPDRTLQSTMTLAPGQSVSGRFEIPSRGSGYVLFQRQVPMKGVEPYPEATTWVGDGKVSSRSWASPWSPRRTRSGSPPGPLRRGGSAGSWCATPMRGP